MPASADRLSPALEATLARYAGLVRQVSQRHGLAGDDVDEVMQAVRIRLWKALGQDERIAEVKPFYVRQTAMSAALDMIRQRRARREEPILETSAPNIGLVHSQAGPGEQVERSEVEEIVGRAIDTLPPRRQPVVRMYLAGYNSTEIAGVFGWSEPKARNLLYRGLAELRDCLQAAGTDTGDIGMSDARLRQTYQEMIARRAGQDRSQCPATERLHELATRHGAEDARLAVANHVMACPHCLPEFELLRSVHEAMPDRKPATRWLALAASVALLLAAGILGRQLLQPRNDVLRESPAVQLVAPAEGEQVSGPVELVWKRVPDAVQYQVQILTPEGEPVYAATTPDTVLIADALAAGSQFIWQVAAEFSTGEPVRSRPTRFSIKPR